MNRIKKFFVNLVSVISFAPFITDVTEEEISSNISQLKKNEWFKRYLEDDKYRDLIISNREVRSTIGNFNNNKIAKDPYNPIYQKKVSKVLEKNNK